jgi:hypothetical protein
MAESSNFQQSLALSTKTDQFRRELQSRELKFVELQKQVQNADAESAEVRTEDVALHDSALSVTMLLLLHTEKRAVRGAAAAPAGRL